jgi:hypothetical protein
MWQRVKPLLSSPARILTFVMLSFFFITSLWLSVAGVRAGSDRDTTNGTIGVVLFAFFIFTTARALETLDAEDRATRTAGGSRTRPQAGALLSVSPPGLGSLARMLSRAYILRLIGFFLVVGVVGLVYGMATLQVGALTWLPVIGLFLFLLVMAVGAFRLQDERDGR